MAVYRWGGHQYKETVATFAEARAIKLARQAEAKAERLGPTLHDYALRWVATHAGLGHDTVSERTRREYRRLLITFALRYFPPKTRIAALDREALQNFITWLAAYRGERGRLADRSIANALVPLRLCLASAEREGLIERGPRRALLPRRRDGRGWHFEQGRFLTREQWPGCSRRFRLPGCRSSSCSPLPACGSPRRSPCAGWISNSMAHLAYGSGAQSSAA